MKNKLLFFEIWDFLKITKKWWLAPLLGTLFIVGMLIVFGSSSAISPFIYALG
jgi:hypothetical protein